MRKYFLARFNSVQSHTGGIHAVIRAVIRSGATVGPDVFKVLYLEKHTEILCDYVLTKLENGPFYGSTDRVRVLEELPSCCRHNTEARQRSLLQHATMYSRITSTKSPSVVVATFTYFTAVLPQLRDCSYYESRRILALPPPRLQKHTALRAHSPDMRHHSTFANVTCT
jgi:hypothetical protein